MALYRYIKFPSHTKKRIRMPLVSSLTLITMGLSILIWVGWPIISFSLFNQYLFASTISPLAEQIDTVFGNPISPVVLASTGNVAGSRSRQLSLENANLWFPTFPQKKVVTPVNSYRLSIPKLKISDATVIIAGDDLMKSLIHYGGTGLPGEYGNAIVFGHSTLPQFYNPNDYRTIFSTVPTLKQGDDIFVVYDGITYRYQVISLTVLQPNDLSGLEQRFDDSYLTLVTCVPPGTYWQRLYVKSRLIRPQT